MLLNRTNLTLSALALSNGLNLGTRSLAVNAGVNNGDQTSHVRHSHHDVMRERMVWYVVFSKPNSIDAIPPIPGSFSPEQQQRPASCLTLPQAYAAVGVCVDPDPRRVDLVRRRETCVLDRDSSIETTISVTGLEQETRILRGCESTTGTELKLKGKHGLKRTAIPAARAAAAAAAAMSTASGK